MRKHTIPFLIGTGLILSACTNTDNPQLAMCQAVAKQLTSNSIASWDKTDQSDSGNNRTVNIKFTSANSQPGSADCHYKILADGTVETSPLKVVLNDQPVGAKDLITAGTKASVELLKGTAANTVAKTKELANEAGEIAADVADKARDAALQGTEALQQKLEE